MHTSRRVRHVDRLCGAAVAFALAAGTTVLAGSPALGSDTTADRAADHAGNAVLTGVPGRTVDGLSAAGAVELRTKSGAKQLLTAPRPRAGALFGSAVHETESWEDDGARYTFVGAPGLTVDGKLDAGGIYVYARQRDQVDFFGVLTQADPEVPGVAQAGARFGASIDSYAFEIDEPPYGDYQDDHLVRLVAGAPGLDVGAANEAGGVVELRLRQVAGGLDVTDQRLHTLASSDAGVEPTSGDQLGTTVRTWAGWSRAEQAWKTRVFAGAPYATVDGKPNAGFVLHTDGDAADQLFYPGRYGVPGLPQAGERFGSALSYATEQLPDGRLRMHLAIGAPGKRVDGEPNAGKVYTLERETAVLGPDSGDRWQAGPGFSQDSPNDGAGEPVGGEAEAGDGFGTAVHFPNPHLKHRYPALFVGVPGEDIRGVSNAGVVNGLYAVPGTHEGKAGGTIGSEHRFGAAISTNEREHTHGGILTMVDFIVGIPGAGNNAGAVVHGTTWLGDNPHPIDWKGRWTLFTGDRRPGDTYGSAFDQGVASS